MTKFTRPTAIQTTPSLKLIGTDLAGSLSEIYRTAGYRSLPPETEQALEETQDAQRLAASNPDPFLTGLEAGEPVEDSEPPVDPELVPDRWKIRDEHMEQEALEYEPLGLVE